MSVKPFIYLLRGVGLSVAVSLAVGGLVLSAGCGGGSNEAQPVLQVAPKTDSEGGREPGYSEHWNQMIIVFFREGTTEAERQTVYDKYQVRFYSRYLEPPYAYNAYIVSVRDDMNRGEVAALMSLEPILANIVVDDTLAP